MNLKFVKWDINRKPCKESGDYLVKAEFMDDSGNKHEWFPKAKDLSEGIGQIEAASKINKLHRNK